MKNILNEKASDKVGARNEFLMNFLANEFNNKTILDIGCGFGWLEYRLKDKVKSIIGIDINKNDIKKARKEVKSNNITFLSGSGLNIPVNSNTVDLVVASEVIEHLPKGSEQLFFKEINRVLKEHGLLFITTPFSDIRSKLTDPAWWFIGHRHYSINDLQKLSKNKFSLIETKISGGFWNMLGLLNLYISKWIFRRNRFFDNYFYQKELAEMNQKKGWMNLMIKFQK